MELLSPKRKIIRLEEVDSTNAQLKNIMAGEHLEEGSMLIANYQSQGRGQMGNSWHSEKNQNLLFSLLIYPDTIKANEQFIISRIASLAIKNALDQLTDGIRIKWPNDIYWNDKKIGGILIENNLQDKKIESSVIGIGLNINQNSFPENLPNPVSLKQITGTHMDLEYVLNLILSEFFVLYRGMQRGEIQRIEDEYMLDLYRSTSYHKYKDKDGEFMAKIELVLPTGHLVLRTLDTDVKRTYAFKEVEFLDN